jgi:hypothetical protein
MADMEPLEEAAAQHPSFGQLLQHPARIIDP